MKNLRITLWVFMTLGLVAAPLSVMMDMTDKFPLEMSYFFIALAMFVVPVFGLFGLFLTDALIRAQKREGLAIKTGDKILFVLYILCVLSPFIVLYIVPKILFIVPKIFFWR